MKRSTVFQLIGAIWVIVCLGAIYWAYEHGIGLLEKPERTGRASRTVPFADERGEVEPIDREPAIPPPLPPRELPVRGFVFDEELRPVVSGVAWIEYARRVASSESAGASSEPAPPAQGGDPAAAASPEIERVEVGADGIFSFDARVRPWIGKFGFDLPGGEGLPPWAVTPWEVVCGDREAIDRPAESTMGVERPERPGRLEWSLDLRDPVPPAGDARHWISIGAVFAEVWGTTARIIVRGATNLPDGAHIACSLRFDRDRVGASFVGGVVAEGEWETEVAVNDEGGLYAGTYVVEAAFNVRLEDGAVVDSWPRRVVDSILEGGDAEIRSRRRIRLGEPDLARREDLATAEYLSSLLPKLRFLELSLDARLREIDRLGQGWSSTLLAEHSRAHETWFGEPLVGAAGFDEPRWRKFLDETWRPALVRLLDAHRARPVRKYREAETRVEGILDSLLRLSQLYSISRVYERFGLPAHEDDIGAFGGSEVRGDIVILERRVRDNFEALEEFGARLAIGDPARDEDDDDGREEEDGGDSERAEGGEDPPDDAR